MAEKFKTTPRKSWTFDDYTNSEIRRACLLYTSDAADEP